MSEEKQLYFINNYLERLLKEPSKDRLLVKAEELKEWVEIFLMIKKMEKFEQSEGAIMNKYLLKYEWYVTGSMGGREDGYPETQLILFDSREALDDCLSNPSYQNKEGMEVYEVGNMIIGRKR